MKKLIMVAIALAFAFGAIAYAQTTTIKNNGDIEIDCAQIEGSVLGVSATLNFEGPSPQGFRWVLDASSVQMCGPSGSSSGGSLCSQCLDSISYKREQGG